MKIQGKLCHMYRSTSLQKKNSRIFCIKNKIQYQTVYISMILKIPEDKGNYDYNL